MDRELTEEEIRKIVKLIVREYGETLRLLGRDS